MCLLMGGLKRPLFIKIILIIANESFLKVIRYTLFVVRAIIITFAYFGIFFRGVLPFSQRKRLWEKYRAKCRKQRPSTNQPEIVCGSQVCMKNSPMYQPGAIGFTVAAGVPKVGQLMNAAWTLSDTCTFKIINVQNSSLERNKESSSGISGLCKFCFNWDPN